MVGVLLAASVFCILIAVAGLSSESMGTAVFFSILAAVCFVSVIPAANYMVRTKNDEKRQEVQKQIDAFRAKCNSKGIRIPALDFQNASQDEQNKWFNNLVLVVRNKWNEARVDFAKTNALTSEILATTIPNLNDCAVSAKAFFYDIGPWRAKLYSQQQVSLWTVFEKNAEGNYTKVIKEFKIGAESIEEFFDKFGEMMDSLDDISAQQIPLDDILYFKTEGDVHYISRVTGTGGGVNAQGAVKGMLELGVLGAVVGSRIGTETKISTTSTRKDDRTILLAYKHNGKITTKSFRHNQIYEDQTDTAIEVLRQLLPDKEYSIQARECQPKPTENKSEFSECDLAKIKQMKELLDMGAITQGEFDTKKKQLLGL